MQIVSKLFPLWVVLSLLLPAAIGWGVRGTLTGALSGLLWGGAVRIFFLHHITFCVNSLCHFFGSRGYETKDHSRNLSWLAPFTFGEAWHNNHHAFPSSARHGLGKAELDPSAALIGLMERLGLAWDVVRISPERLASKAIG